MPRFLADPTWGTLTFWMPLYLSQTRGWDLKKIALFAWLPFLAADIGCLFGGWLSLWLQKRTDKRGKVVERYEELGLAIFVGIPLPGTGAWTGALLAKFFNLPLAKSLLWIFVGVLLAATAVTAITVLGTSLLG